MFKQYSLSEQAPTASLFKHFCMAEKYENKFKHYERIVHLESRKGIQLCLKKHCMTLW